LTDKDVAIVRALAADGVPRKEVAERFGVSAQHVGRIVRGAARAPLAALVVEQGSVSAAVAAFLAGLERDARDEVLAQTALALAYKLDQLRESTSAASAGAVPGVARALVDTVEAMRAPAPPDRIDELQRRHHARRLALIAGSRK
jgi:hypothetical protein